MQDEQDEAVGLTRPCALLLLVFVVFVFVFLLDSRVSLYYY